MNYSNAPGILYLEKERGLSIFQRLEAVILKFFYTLTSTFFPLVFSKEEKADVIPFPAKEKVKSDEEVAAAFDKYGNSILRLAYSYLHNESDAEDILQETLIRYMKKAPNFESAEHEKAWLLRVAMNLSKNRIEYNNVRSTDELNDELVAEERKDLSFVWEAVKLLPIRQREVIHLFYQEGYSSKDIAGILSQNESTVRSNLKRGREKLKEILKEEFDFA